jgi:two-component system cell cycle response regulator DivK
MPEKIPEILIVEDNLLNLTVEANALKSFGYEPKKARDGFEALEILSNNEIDLILMDMELPKMHGLELLQQIKSNPKTQNIRVIAVTGHCDQESKEKFLNAGCYAILPKPINFGSFKRKIEEFLLNNY